MSLLTKMSQLGLYEIIRTFGNGFTYAQYIVGANKRSPHKGAMHYKIRVRWWRLYNMLNFTISWLYKLHIACVNFTYLRMYKLHIT